MSPIDPPNTDELRDGLHRLGDVIAGPPGGLDMARLHPDDHGFDLSVEISPDHAGLGRKVDVGLSNASSGVMAIAAERHRHMTDPVFAFGADHDDAHLLGELASAAACYASPVGIFRLVPGERLHFIDPFPWRDGDWDKRSPRPMAGGYVMPLGTDPDLIDGGDAVVSIAARKREVEKAGALLAAEWDRLDRMEQRLRAEAEHFDRMPAWIRSALVVLVQTGAFAALSNEEACTLIREKARLVSEEIEEIDIRLGVEVTRARVASDPDASGLEDAEEGGE